MQLDVSFAVHCQYALYGFSDLDPCSKALAVGITAFRDLFTVGLSPYSILASKKKDKTRRSIHLRKRF